MLLKSPFIDAERTFNVAERIFIDAERTFNVAERIFNVAERTFSVDERRFNIAEYRKTNRCCYFFSRAPMLMISVSKTIYR